jgi:SAM-dependent methyltransferase
VSDDQADGDTEDFSTFLHGLRSRELTRLPGGAKVVLSGGAAGTWYFDWFEQHYPTPIERHIGVEAFESRPDDLPKHVEWIASSLGDLGPVQSNSVDLVFGGEVIEHMWPDEIAGFLAGAHRVLRPRGRIALDSPNRTVTQAIGWLHPEHTVEFSVDEIVELLELAGFEDVSVRGVFLGYDRERHRYLPLDDATMTRAERDARAITAPEDSFVWWAEAVRSSRVPSVPVLEQRLWELFARFRSMRFGQLRSAVGYAFELPHHGRVVRARRGETGALLLGPTAPMPPGRLRATFELAAARTGSLAHNERVGWIDVVSTDRPASPLARLELPLSSFGDDAQWSRHSLDFLLEETTLGLEFRLFSDGIAEITARSFLDVRPAQVQNAPPTALPRRPTRDRIMAALRGQPSYSAVAQRLLAKLRRSQRSGGNGYR